MVDLSGSMAEQFKQRCFLVYAVAPDSTPASEANERVNEYIGDRSRGIVVYHDHYTGAPHGGFAVLDVRSDAELARLEDPGPLAGWQVRVHGLTFSLSSVGFAEQMRLTLREYAGTSLEELRERETDDPRFWWARH